jgi:type 1 glutamine amidotransferase
MLILLFLLGRFCWASIEISEHRKRRDMATRVLVLCDDKWHPASTVRGGVEALGTEDFTFDVIENGSEWSAERMGQYPLVLLAKSNQNSATDETAWITPEVEEAFVDYVRAGGGLLAVHAGSVVAELPTLRRLIGGAFVKHPPKCDVTVTPQGYHPITEKVEPFTVFDEHYFMQTDDLEAHHFLTTTSEHGAQSGGWLREEGEGRVCVLTPGHTAEAWLHEEFQTLLRNSLLWCMKELAG